MNTTNPLAIGYHIFNLLFRPNQFLRSARGHLWKDENIQQCMAEFWSTIYRTTLEQCMWSACSMAYDEIKEKYKDILYAKVVSILEQRSDAYTCLLFNNPEYWIYITSIYIKSTAKENIAWSSEDQLKYIESRKQKFVADHQPGGDLGYRALFENNIEEIVKKANFFKWNLNIK